MTIKEIQRTHAENLTDSIMLLPTLEKKEVRDTIEAHLTIYTVNLLKKKIENLNNTLEQLNENLKATDDPQTKQKLKVRIEEVKARMSMNNMIVTESRRMNSYRRLRNMLKDKGLDVILEEFDEETKRLQTEESASHV